MVSELRKQGRCNPRVAAWFARVSPEEIFFSVLTLGEIRRGIESIRRRDVRSAEALEAWLDELATTYADRILAVDQSVAEEWGRLNVPNRRSVIDALLAATAKVHDLTLVTRNLRDIKGTGVSWFDPFGAGA